MTTSQTTEMPRTGSEFWRRSFRLLFRLTPNRLVLRIVALTSRLPIAPVEIVGRRSGTVRTYPLSVLDVDGRWYIGHPNGRSQWVHNLMAAGTATVTRGGHRIAVRAIDLDDCPERDAAVRATAQQPFPANLLYRAGRRHVAAAGTYFRLEPVESEGVVQ